MLVNVCLILPSAPSPAPGSVLRPGPVDCFFRVLPTLPLTSCQETKSDPPPFSPKTTDGFANMAAAHTPTPHPHPTCLPPPINSGSQMSIFGRKKKTKRCLRPGHTAPQNPLTTSQFHLKHAWLVVFVTSPRKWIAPVSVPRATTATLIVSPFEKDHPDTHARAQILTQLPRLCLCILFTLHVCTYTPYIRAHPPCDVVVNA